MEDLDNCIAIFILGLTAEPHRQQAVGSFSKQMMMNINCIDLKAEDQKSIQIV